MEDDLVGPAPANMWEITSTVGEETMFSAAQYTQFLLEAGFKNVTLLRTQTECLYDAMFAEKA